MKTLVALQLRSKGVPLLNHFGATELGALAPIFKPDKQYDCTYLRIRKDMGLRLESEDGFENTCRLIGQPFGWDRPFELQDRLERNPSKPDEEVRILGRKDDVIVLATGEKVTPVTLEHALEQNPRVKRAVAFGQGQSEIGILLEPSSSDDEGDFIESIWPTISAANEYMDRVR